MGRRYLCQQVTLAGALVVVSGGGAVASNAAAASPDESSQTSELWVDPVKPVDNLWGFMTERFGEMAPPPSLVKCVGATFAGSIFALVGMLVEGRRGKKGGANQVSREELGKLIPKRPSVSDPSASQGTKPGSVAAEGRRGSSDSNGTVSQKSPASSAALGGAKAPTADAAKTQVSTAPSPPASTLARTTSEVVEKPAPPGGDSLQRSRSDGGASLGSSGGEGGGGGAPGRPVFRFGRELTEVERTERQVKSILNKLTRDKFDTLYDQLLGCCQNSEPEARGDIIRVIAREVFAKATLQHTFVDMYADVCSKLHADLQTANVEVNFKRALLDQCQESFNHHLAPPRIDEELDYEERYEALVKYKTKMLGNVRLIGHLLRQRMLSPKIIFHCTEELLTIGSPEALETLATFLETLGSAFDTKEWAGRARLEEVFAKIELVALDKDQAPRIKCLMKDLLDKRSRGWRAGWASGGSFDNSSTTTRTPSGDCGRPAGFRRISNSGTSTPCGSPSGEARLIRRSTLPASGGGDADQCRTPGTGRSSPGGGWNAAAQERMSN